MPTVTTDYTLPAPYVPAVVCVTGATGGFGSAFARRFAALGARLILTGRRGDRLAALKAELGVPVHILEIDSRDRAAVEQAIATLPDPFAAIDLLINNAGLALGADPAPIADPDDWEVMIDTNNKGLVITTRAVLPGMVARKRGHILNLGSIAGSYPYPGGHVYCATKAFVAQFSLALRADLAGTNVRVTCLEPGMCETDFSLVRFKGDPERAAKVYAGAVALSAEDVAEAGVWAATLPPHFNVNRLEIMPQAQSFSPLAVYRQG